MASIVLLSGEIATGKSKVARALEDWYDFHRVATGAYLKTLAQKRNLELNRDTLKDVGDALDLETHGRWVSELAFAQSLQASGDRNWLLDSIRRDFQIQWFREIFDTTLHVHLTASEEERRRRYAERQLRAGDYDNDTSYEEAISGPTEEHAKTLGGICDLLINTDRISPEDAAEKITIELHELQNM